MNYGGSSQSPSQFGGFGGGQGGGGFLASPNGGGGGGQGSLFSPGGGAGASGPANRSLVPVTARQIANSQQPEGQTGILIDGHEAGQVKVVARIMTLAPQSTYIELHVHDGTAPLEVRYWYEKDDNGTSDGDMEGKFREGQYVRIVGKLKFFQNQCSLQAHAVVPLTDFNEITYHLLECMYVHEMRTKSDAGMVGQSQTQQMQQHTGFASQAQNVPMHGVGMAPAQPFSADAGGNDAISPLQSQVFQIIQQDTSEPGASVQTVATALAGQPGAGIQQIRQAVEYLSNEGHVYSTIDEEHFKCT